MPSALQAMACFPLPPAPRSHLVCTGLPAYSSCSVATPASAADTKAGCSDLASALPKIDETDDIQQYAKLLYEFAVCRQADMNNEEEGPEFSETEKVAVSIYFAGILSMAQLFTLAFEDAFTENTAANDQTEDEPSTYEMLEMALTACHPAHPPNPKNHSSDNRTNAPVPAAPLPS